MVSTKSQFLVVTAAAAVALCWQLLSAGDFIDLWLTPDQQGRLAYEAREFGPAADVFQDIEWAATASYEAGRYEESAARYALSASAFAAFNRGNALMKARRYAQAVSAYELAVQEAPAWKQAQFNLALSAYVLDYAERVREQGDTGDESEISADGYEFDNRKNQGKAMVITSDSVIQAASAEKWMRSVNTETREFLQMRFSLEAARQNQ